MAICHVAYTGGKRNAHIDLVCKLEGNVPLGRHRWEDNITVHLKETGFDGMNWIHLAQYMDKWWDLVNTVMNLLGPQNGMNFLTR
jgi:hypothetical protein